ncbi:MAG: thioredoxin domain-containing protein [Croceivirga sp.]
MEITKKWILIVLVLVLCGCQENKTNHKYTNALIEETSPYLLQHAHNPVNWEAWKPKVLERAKKEDKPILISIGYAACHWCHVMEDECFEDEAVAQFMNDNFINIKIDREERPDVDQIYMDALNIITGGNGGWPLNIIALPNGKPFWGSTYLPKDNWITSLEKLTELYKTDKGRLEEIASNLEGGIKAINLVEVNTKNERFPLDSLAASVNNWSSYFDTYLGGYKQTQKFMMPNNWDFLMHYAVSEKNDSIMKYVNTTLTRMAYGGIFDPIDGGFSRYAVDTKWHVPHFEKMLYDNGQLTSLYAKAYAVTKNPLYKEIVAKTIDFVQLELMDENGGFYSSLDADSKNEQGELEEGAYYVWTEYELDSLLGSDFPVFKDYYNINSYGYWEEGNYVLIRDKSDEEIAGKHEMTIPQLKRKIEKSLKQLKVVRDQREKPRLDNKILTSWNGLMLKGLVDAYRYLQDEEYLELALKNAKFLNQEMIKDDGTLYRNHKNGKSTINGFLDDYGALIEAYIALYEVTLDQDWLEKAKALADTAIKYFKDEESGMFFYTSNKDNSLIRKSIEQYDKEISSSNSIMATNLLKLHKLFPKRGYMEQADQMVRNVQKDFIENGQSFANWLNLILFQNKNFYEIAVVGENYKVFGNKIASNYLPNSILVGSKEEGTLDLLKSRYNEGQTLIYVCIEGTCKLPVTTVEQTLKQL